MRHVLAPFRCKADALHQPFVFSLYVKEGLLLRHGGRYRTRLAAPKGGEALQVQFESVALDPAQQGGNFMGDQVVDVADETQCQVVIFRIDPARSRQSAAQHTKRLANVGWDFDTGEKTRHKRQLLLSVTARARLAPGR